MEAKEKQRALLIIHPSRSHLNAVRKLARVMKDHFELAVCGAAIGRRQMERYGVKVYGLDSMPVGSGFERFLSRESSRYDYLSELKLRKSMQLFKSRVASLNSVLDDWQPAIFFVDILYITDLLIIQRWFGPAEETTKRIYLIRTKPALRRRKFTLPSVYAKAYKGRFQSTVLWELFNLKKWANRLWDFVRFQAYDDLSILRKASKSLLGPSSRLSISWRNGIGPHIGKFRELVLIPREFEFGDFVPDKNEYYLGFQYEIPQGILSERAKAALTEAQKAKSEGKKVITISFGSLYSRFEKETDTILHKLAAALASVSNEVFIVFVGKLERINHLFSDFAYSTINEAPLAKVLAISNLHICHGGINTIKDCIFSCTPMLIFPLNSNWDQPGNAAKVEYHHLGLVSSLNVEIKVLHTQLNLLLHDFVETAFQKFITLEKTKYRDLMSLLKWPEALVT